MSLKETLSELDDMVPAVPRQVAEVLEEGGRFKEQVEHLLEEFEDKRGQARELVDKVRQALGAMRDQAAEHARTVETALGAVDGAVRGLTDAIAEGRSEVGSAVEAAGGA